MIELNNINKIMAFFSILAIFCIFYFSIIFFRKGLCNVKNIDRWFTLSIMLLCVCLPFTSIYYHKKGRIAVDLMDRSFNPHVGWNIDPYMSLRMIVSAPDTIRYPVRFNFPYLQWSVDGYAEYVMNKSRLEEFYKNRDYHDSIVKPLLKKSFLEAKKYSHPKSELFLATVDSIFVTSYPGKNPPILVLQGEIIISLERKNNTSFTHK